MTRTKATIVLALVCVLFLSAGAGAWKYFSDEAAWGRMDRSLIRLQSGIRYEAIINVQSRLADADAATREYSSKWRLFPIGHRGAAQNAERGIAEIEEALRWQRWAAAAENGEDVEPSHLEELQKYPGVFARVKLGCEGPAVKVDPTAVAVDFLTKGKKWIDAANNRRSVAAAHTNVPSLSQKYSQCAAVFRAAQEADAEKRTKAERIAKQKRESAEAARQAEDEAIAARKAAAQAAWRKRWSSFSYRVVFHSACENYSASVDGQTAKPIRTSNGSDYFGVRHSMYVKSRCPQIGLSSVQLNGHPYSLKWKPDGKGGWLAWVVRSQE